MSEDIGIVECFGERLTPLELVMDKLEELRVDVDEAGITTQEFIDRHKVLMREIRDNIRAGN